MRGVGKATINSKRLKQMTRQLGMNVKELNDVEEVIIKTANANFVFKDSIVTVVEVQGSKMYQITGTPEEYPRDSARAKEDIYILKEDIELVMEKAGCTEKVAKEALMETKGDLAEAITKLSC